MRKVLASPLSWAPVVVAAILLVGLATTSLAQTDVTTARISGTVKDVDGGMLPGVTVEAKNQDTGLVVRSVSDARGFFRILNLPPGTYTLSAELQGFATVSKADVRVLLGQAPTVDFTMQLAAATESITVTSEVPLVEVSQTAATTTVQNEQINQLPVAGRDFTNLVLLTPESGNRNERNYLTLSGQRGINTSVMVDGVDYNNAFFGGTAGSAEGRAPLSISQESIKEFTVITNGASAEFGRSGGGFVNVITKTGTNEFRGSAFYYGTPNAWVSDRADGSTLNNQDKKQYGGSFGGPIMKDKLFFFASYDEQKQNTDIQIDPTFLSRSAAFFQKWPVLASEDSFTQTRNGRVFFGRFDFQANPSNRITFRGNYADYNGDHGTLSSTTGASNENGIEHMYNHTYVGAWSATLSDSMLNDLTAQYQVESTPRENLPETDPYAQVTIGSYYYGGVSYLPIVASQYRKAITDSFSYLVGEHVFKAGFDYNDTNMNQIFKGNWRGVYKFYTQADAVAGKWYQYYQYGGLNGKTADEGGQFDQSQKELALFVQDQWFITPTLTATLGIRYEKLDNPNDAVLNLDHKNTNGSYALDGQIADQNDQWSPRLGLTWSPGDGKTVVRFTAGTFYSRTPSILFAQLYTSNGLSGTQYTINAPYNSTTGVVSPPTDPLSPGWGANWNPNRAAIDLSSMKTPTKLGVFVMDPNFQNPITDRITIGFEREIFKDTAVSLDATWAETSHLERMIDYNLAYARNADGSLKLSPINNMPVYASTRPNAYYGRVSGYVSDAHSEFYSIAAVLNRRFTERVFGFLAVTYSQDKDNDSNERNYAGFQAEDVNKLNDSWGYSVRDQRWKIALNGVWNTPWWDISFSGTYRYVTGAPYTATTLTDANADGFTNDRPTINGVHFERNSYRYPDASSLDLRLAKAVKLGPTKVSVTFDCFNCTNNANWSIPSAGLIWGNNQTASAAFGKATTPTSSTRTYQGGLRFEF
jgi:hypothetical protein